MGLAASQARFLAITARKANCEFQSMQIAQEKLSLTRELEKATEEYQLALNQTKLVWDPDGTGDNAFDLSYDIMMKPSAVNNYTPYLITTRDGKVVLDSKMAAAARAAGIPEGGINNKTVILEDGTKTTLYAQMYSDFINQMVKTGGMSESSAVSCRKIGLIEQVGIGGPLVDKTQASEMGINDLIVYMENVIATGSKGTNAQKELADKLTFKFGYDAEGNDLGLNLKSSIADKGDSNSNYFTVNHSITTDTDFTLSDLLTEDITFAKTGDKVSISWWKKLVAGIAAVMTGGAVGGILFGGIVGLCTYNGIINFLGTTQPDWEDTTSESDKALIYFINDMANAFVALFDVENGDEQTQQAFAYALQQTLGLLGDCRDLGDNKHSTDAFDNAVNNADNYNGWVMKNATKNKNYGTQAISLSNLTESFMTYYAQGLNGFDQSYYIVTDGAQSSYVTDDPYYMWTVKNENANSTEEIYVAEFYSALFNNICQNGWIENDQIDDEEYLSNTLKNATYFISSMSNDFYYYQDRYLDNGYVVEVTDDDAITAAELEYTQKKSRINYKEEELEVDMKQLDLEISSLTTEYDTVKNLINNNVEKTFTMFSS